jgi:U3 small nucleolar ribonucleoprotein component
LINNVENARIDDPEVWAPYDWMTQQDREPIKELYGLTDDYLDELSWYDFETLTDETTALDFEGTEHAHMEYFSDDEWELTH